MKTICNNNIPNVRKRNSLQNIFRFKFHNVMSDTRIKNPSILKANINNIKDLNHNRSIFKHID